jgi:hypothetical protein
VATSTIDPKLLQDSGPQLAPGQIYSENDELLLLAKSLLPALVLIVIVVGFVRARRS